MKKPNIINNPFFTIGHSTRTIEEFIELLQINGVTHLVDVRTMPRSRTNPQFNQDNLKQALKKHKIKYYYLESLSGFRKRSKDIDPKVNGFWSNQSFHNYADYTSTDEFREGVDELLALGSDGVCAVMCAEVLWWRCHRRIIADYLLYRGVKVFHIINHSKAKPAALTKGAKKNQGTLVYPEGQ